jgi:hypothetical protein
VTKVVAAEPIGELHYGRAGGNLVEFCYERSMATATPLFAAATLDPVTGAPRSSPTVPKTPPPALPPAATARVPDLDRSRRTAVEALTDLAAVTAARLARPTERVSGNAARSAAELASAAGADPSAALGFHGRGTTVGTVALRAKSRVHISGVASWAEGDWYVRRVNHIYQRSATGSRPTYSTDFIATR